ncbi:MAG: PKD-like domain-containing protein [Bacteroidia bacterium]
MKISYKLLTVLLVFCGLNLKAQWTQTNGPYTSGRVNCFATDGSTIFTATQSSGIFTSANFGSSWNEANNGYAIYPLHTLLMNGSDIWAAGEDGLYLSTNNGASWNSVKGGSSYSNSDVIMLGTTVIVADNGGIYRSTNNGSSWTQVSTETNATLVVVGNNYLAASGGGVFLSTNDGVTWGSVNGAMTTINEMKASGSSIYAGTNGGGVYLSTDNGSTWATRNTGLSGSALTVNCLAFDGTDLYAGTGGAGVYRSTNSGASWSAVNTGITTTTVYDVTVMGANIFIATATSGVEVTSNFGASWATANNGIITSDVRALMYDGSSNVYAGSNGTGAFLTSSNGANWNGVNIGLTGQTVNRFAYIGTNVFAATNAGVFLTTNNGASWTAVNTGLTSTSVQTLVAMGSSLFAGTLGGGVCVSTNNGTSWSAVNTGFTSNNILTMTASGSNLFAGTDTKGVFFSSNNGSSWAPVNTGLPGSYIYSVVSIGANIFAAVSGSGVYWSNNNGSSWSSVNSGISGSTYELGVSGTNLFAFGGGMNISTNNGASWSNIAAGLPVIVNYGLTVDANTVFVGTTGLGVWKRHLDEILCSINPPVMSSASSQTICSGQSVNIPLANTGVSATYSWVAASNSQASGESTTVQTTSAINNTIVNNSSLTATNVVYTVTPKGVVGGCSGNPQTVTVTVNPNPVMSSNSAMTICSGQAVGLSFTSSVASSYSWIAASNGNVTGASLSSQISPALTDVLVNTSLVPQTVAYTVTPTSSGGSCQGPSQTVNVTLNPTPVMTSTSAVTICSGATVNIPLTSNVNSNFTWVAANNINTSGASTSIQSPPTLSNSIVNNTAVPQNVVYTVVPTAVVGGCSGSQTVTVTVNPAPVMTSSTSATICSGGTVNIPLTSNIASNYQWNATTSNPNTTGESLSPQTTSALNNTITNNSSSSQVVYYTVIPSSVSGGCAGASQSVSVTVNPVPVMTSTTTASLCSGGALNINLSASITSSFTWIASTSTIVSGESTTLQSTGTINDVLTSTGTNPQNITYTVTPTATILGSCAGAAQTVTVTVNPVPVMSSASAVTICGGTAVNIPLTSNVASTFEWSAANNVNTSGASLSSQTSSTLNNTISNNTSVPQNVVYTVIPTSLAGSCPGSAQTVTVTVNPAPVMISSSSAAVCSGGTVNIPLVSTTGGTFSWIAASNPNVTGESTTAQATSTLHNILVSSSSTVQDVVYTVTPTSSLGCSGGGQLVSVLVNPLDNAGFNYSSGTYCQSGNDPSAVITGVSGGSFSSTAGLVFLNTNNGLVNLAASALGTYTITYTTNSSCNNTSTFNLSITPAPLAAFSYANASYCASAGNPVPVMGSGSTAGMFSANPSGLAFVSTSTGQVNLSGSVPGTYMVTNTIAASGGCAGVTASTQITVNALPVVSFTGLATTYYYNDPAAPLTGTPAGGTYTGTGISGNLFKPAVAGAGTFPITYSFTDAHGCSNTTSATSTTVLAQPAPPHICEVTVDDSSVYNIVYWEKTAYTNVDSFVVFRETGAGYQQIGAVPGTAFSAFTDTVRHKYFPNTGNPNAGTYRYKLQIRDSLGHYSPMSPFHNTIYINQTFGTFTWNHYEIEGQPVPLPSATLISYDLWRKDSTTGPWNIVNSVAGSQLTQTDVGWNAALQHAASWRIETNWDIQCNPTRTLINTSHSNIRHPATAINLGITELELSNAVSVYPNPGMGEVTVQLSIAAQDLTIRLYDMVGQVVYQAPVTSQKTMLDISGFARGVYTLEVANKNVKGFKKLIVQ